MKKTWVFLCLFALAASVPGFAAEKKKPLVDVSGGQGYGTAGCGLGSIVFGDQKGMIQIVAATLNGTGVQTFGITSGTSNCANTGTRDTKSAALFITANRDALEKDAARGNGETIATLSTLVGCADVKAFGSQLQTNYGKIFPSQKVSTENVVDSIVDLSKSCG
jgi:hypothetical protein